MKKVLSILSLIAILGMSAPAFAAPHGGHHGGGPKPSHHRPHVAHHGHHHRGSVMVHTGHHPRHSHWYGYRSSYRWCPWCGYRLGHCPHYPSFGAYVPIGGAGFSIHF